MFVNWCDLFHKKKLNWEKNQSSASKNQYAEKSLKLSLQIEHVPLNK